MTAKRSGSRQTVPPLGVFLRVSAVGSPRSHDMENWLVEFHTHVCTRHTAAQTGTEWVGPVDHPGRTGVLESAQRLQGFGESVRDAPARRPSCRLPILRRELRVRRRC